MATSASRSWWLGSHLLRSKCICSYALLCNFLQLIGRDGGFDCFLRALSAHPLNSMQRQAGSACCRGRARAVPQRTHPRYIHAAFSRSSWRPRHYQANHGLLRAAKSEADTTNYPLTSTVETIGDCIQWGSCVSTRSKLKAALAEAVTNINSGMDRTFEPELAIVFASCSYGRELEKLVPLLRAQCPTLKYIFGSTVSTSGTILLPGRAAPSATHMACSNLLL